ncbi:hypothetical protein GDO78_008987 [Eleutherodactylus coqui]|uniref:Uncharacterized protein n=1 Tax=Eleutherodactylus coqui TaxID=57060 RepID=A0A8J6FEL6_ELECQ|nr:hypothetical protein GDO78_008987 [Eleutherodactylus coqui]
MFMYFCPNEGLLQKHSLVQSERKNSTADRSYVVESAAGMVCPLIYVINAAESCNTFKRQRAVKEQIAGSLHACKDELFVPGLCQLQNSFHYVWNGYYI